MNLTTQPTIRYSKNDPCHTISHTLTDSPAHTHTQLSHTHAHTVWRVVRTTAAVLNGRTLPLESSASATYTELAAAKTNAAPAVMEMRGVIKTNTL